MQGIDRIHRKTLWLVACLMVFVCLCLSQAGCGPKRKTELTVKGRIEHKGKPVYPVAILIQDDSGKGNSANVGNPEGAFLIAVENGKKYKVAIEPIESRTVTKAEQAEVAKRAAKAKEEGRELRREDTIGAASLSSNSDFPDKYLNFDTSGLIIDCTNGVPGEPIVLELK
jgi:hypothetical protein